MKLNLGCGAKPLKGYINIDAPKTKASDPHIRADVYSKIEDLKYDDGSIEGIKMEACFEHFPRHKALFLLKRFYKWLKVGGWISIVVPDLMGAIHKINTVKDLSLKMFYFRHIFGPQDVLEYGTHYDGFTDDKLKYTFSRVGFNRFRAVHKGRWPSIYFTAWKDEPLLDDEKAIVNIYETLRMYARGRKVDYMVNNWIQQCKDSNLLD